MAKSVRFARRKRSSFKKRRAQIGKKSQVARVRRSRRRVKVMRGGAPKKILLIIDPQKDFTKPFYETYTIGKMGISRDDFDKLKIGSLGVPGATRDYEKIISLIKTIKFDEIHVSLDTHNLLHIGHPGFWKVVNQDGTDTSEEVPPLVMLNIEDGDKITGTSIIGAFAGKKYFRVNTENTALINYVNTYLKFYRGDYVDYPNRHKQSAFIWPNHCIEKNDGHKVYQKLQTALNLQGNKVKYHIKGQNNLSEMFSIFSAEIAVEDVLKLAKIDKSTIESSIYTGTNTIVGQSSSKYEDVIELLNLDTRVNHEFIRELVGDISNPNTVYVCGQASTHCVKSSTIDLLDYSGLSDELKTKSIIVITDACSPIGGPVPHTQAIQEMQSHKAGITDYSSLTNPNVSKATAASLAQRYVAPDKPVEPIGWEIAYASQPGFIKLG